MVKYYWRLETGDWRLEAAVHQWVELSNFNMVNSIHIVISRLVIRTLLFRLTSYG